MEALVFEHAGGGCNDVGISGTGISLADLVPDSAPFKKSKKSVHVKVYILCNSFSILPGHWNHQGGGGKSQLAQCPLIPHTSSISGRGHIIIEDSCKGGFGC